MQLRVVHPQASLQAPHHRLDPYLKITWQRQGSVQGNSFTDCPGEVRGSAQHMLISSPSRRHPDKVEPMEQDGEILRAGPYRIYLCLPETQHKPKHRPRHSKYLVNSYGLSCTFPTRRSYCSSKNHIGSPLLQEAFSDPLRQSCGSFLSSHTCYTFL